VRQFTAEYLERTRRGMWDDSRAALSTLSLADHERVLDVGSGTGELTRVLREEVPGEVIGLDADRGLLDHAGQPVIQGDATRLPFADDAFDLVVCQALLINLPDPAAAIEEFARVSSDLVAAVEPDNSAVSVDSTVDAEPPLARRARRFYLAGVDTDVTLGAGVGDLFREAGLATVTTHRYDHEKRIEPPYSTAAVEAARRKASGKRLAENRETMLASGVDAEAYDELRQAWRAMGRDVVEQMQRDAYRRVETVPFYVTVGEV
jgi:SAM-dependent methyltransferase